jgi:hypothetical protein
MWGGMGIGQRRGAGVQHQPISVQHQHQPCATSGGNILT